MWRLESVIWGMGKGFYLVKVDIVICACYTLHSNNILFLLISFYNFLCFIGNLAIHKVVIKIIAMDIFALNEKKSLYENLQIFSLSV